MPRLPAPSLVLGLTLLLALGATVTGIRLGRPPDGGGIGDPYLPAAGDPGYDALRYDLRLRYDPPTDRLVGRATITARATAPLREFGLDLSLPVSTVTVDGRPARISQRDGKLRITPAVPVAAGQTLTAVVDYAGSPSEVRVGPGVEAPWLRTGDGALAVGEPQGAAWWYPSNDHPSDKASFSIEVTVPAGLAAISNGELLGGPEPVAVGTRPAGSGAEPGGTGSGWVRWRWRESEPMATYLAFLAIGHYDIVRRPTPVGEFLAAYGAGLPADHAATARAAIERTPEIVAYLSTLFGPYPFAQLGGVAPDAPEFRDSLETQTRPVYADRDPDERLSTTVHELAHQWFGDSVSLRSWRDIWLNEGFARYAEWLWAEHTGGPTTRQAAARSYSAYSADDDFWTVRVDDPGIDDLFTSAVYSRGAMALQALRAEVGDRAFFATLRTWTGRRRGGNGSTADFLTTLNRVSGRDVTAVARTWLSDPTRPPDPPG